MNNDPQVKSKGTLRGILIISVLAFLLAGVIWLLKSNEIMELKKENKKEKEVWLKESKDQRLRMEIEHLKAIAKPVVWAFRTEMMQGDLKSVKEYSNDLVKEKGFKSILVASKKGIILASTNKKHEGAHFSTVDQNDKLTWDETDVQKVNDSTLIMTSPIMGFNSRLGTLYVKYQFSY